MPEDNSQLLEPGTYKVLYDFATLKAGLTVELLSSHYVFTGDDFGYGLIFSNHDRILLIKSDQEVVKNISKYLQRCEGINLSQSRGEYLKQKRLEAENAQREAEAFEELTRDAIREEISKNGLSPKEAYQKVRKIFRS